MPELPEVETTVRALRPYLLNQTFTYVWNDWPRHIATPSLEELRFRLPGRCIQAIHRRAKYLVFSLSDDETLIIHLKMSGRLLVVDRDEPKDKHVHTAFGLEHGQELRFWDLRKFGRVYLVHNPEQVLAGLGPEPLEGGFTAEALQERLYGRTRFLKTLLLDQSFIAGVGNIYADESLFYARLHPQRLANALQPDEVAALHTAIQKALNMGIEREGASINLYMKPDGSKGDMQNAVAVYQRTGDPCPRCGTPIERIVLGGRSTHFCPQCQR
jgi:formamidopyrimidine-DNA glycosylase